MKVKSTPKVLTWIYYLFIISLPVYSFSVLNIGGRAYGRFDWILSIVLILGSVYFHLHPNASFVINRTAVYVLLFLFIGLLSSINLFNASNNQLVDYSTKAVQLLLVTLLFVAISNLKLTEHEFLAIFRLWFFISVLVSLYGIYQLPARLNNWPLAYLNLSNPTTAPGGIQTARKILVYSQNRVSIARRLSYMDSIQISSLFREPTWLGSYLLAPILLFGNIVLNGKDKNVLFKLRAANYVGYICIIICFLLTMSIGSYLSLVLVLTFIYLAKYIKSDMSSRFLSRFIIICTGGLFISWFAAKNVVISISHRVLDFLNSLIFGVGPGGSFTIRLEKITETLNVWIEHPILGVGLNNTRYFSQFDHVNSGWIELLSEVGILGFFVISLIIISLVQNLFRVRNLLDRSSGSFYIVTGLIYVLVGASIDTFVTFNWTHTLRWFTLSLSNLVILYFSFNYSSKRIYQPSI